MTSPIDWGYDKLRDRRAENQAEQKEYNNMSDHSRYDEIMMKQAQHTGRRINRQEGARNTLDKAGYDFSDLSGYDHGSAGNKKFDRQDIKFLRGQGKTKDEIKNYIGTLGADALSENVRYNKKFGGDHYVGDNDRNTKLISDFDTGRGYNNSDIKYLKSQGYTGAEIAEDMVNRADHFGKHSAKFLKEQGRFDDWNTANDARRAEAKDRAQEQINKPDKPTDQPTNNPGSGMPDLSGFMTPMPGSNTNGNSNNSGSGLDLSQYMTPMNGYGSSSDSDNKKNNYYGGLDLSKYMTNY